MIDLDPKMLASLKKKADDAAEDYMQKIPTPREGGRLGYKTGYIRGALEVMSEDAKVIKSAKDYIAALTGRGYSTHLEMTKMAYEKAVEAYGKQAR